MAGSWQPGFQNERYIYASGKIFRGGNLCEKSNYRHRIRSLANPISSKSKMSAHNVRIKENLFENRQICNLIPQSEKKSQNKEQKCQNRYFK